MAVGVCCMLLSAASFSQADDYWTVSLQSEGRSVASSAVALDWGKGPVLVTVSTDGGDISQPIVAQGAKRVESRLAGFDEISRLCFFRPNESERVKAPVWAASAPSGEGVVLKITKGGTEFVGRTEGWVNRIGGKVLPFALLRVGFGGVKPAAGTPMLDESGRVAAVVFRNGEESVYAIPAEAVHRVARDVAQDGRLRKGWLGVSLRVENESPRIVRVIPGSPAADAGLREDDLITKIASRPMGSYADVANSFFYMVPGQAVDLEVRRGESLLAFTLLPASERSRR